MLYSYQEITSNSIQDVDRGKADDDKGIILDLLQNYTTWMHRTVGDLSLDCRWHDHPGLYVHPQFFNGRVRTFGGNQDD